MNLLSYLATLGIAPDQIEIEKTLRQRLGHGLHDLVSDVATDRLDLLIRSRMTLLSGIDEISVM
jgi:hypothetical protein